MYEEGSAAGLFLCTLILLMALVQGGRLSFGVFLAEFLTLRRQLVIFLVELCQP